jgi:hypothetical protein
LSLLAGPIVEMLQVKTAFRTHMSVQKRSMCAPARTSGTCLRGQGASDERRIGASARVEAAGTRVFERVDADLVP